ncbi:MAG: polyphosphate polymerase domain-containing protein, partial [Clostridiales bacterium]|nr:polyphosphate polymerase domain-containing protein [Clostridiales bacterium]
MAIEVFNRYENKYMLDDKTCQALQARLSDYCELDAYNKRFETYPICNIYYDTEDSCLIRTSLAKPSYKEKLRIRSYGVPDAGSNVYVEIKKKHRNLVNKRRSALPLRDAYSFLRSGVVAITPDCANAQVLAEIQCILERHQLMPKAFISYERKAYFGTDHHDLRISFDTEIRTRRTSLRLESGIFGERLMPDGKWLMEI